MASSTAGERAESLSEDGMVRISAVVCTFNRAAYLAKAVESLINQTYPREHYEIIVVDNGSTDNTRDVVEQFGQSARIKYIYEPIKGLSQARNTGWQAAGGEYIAYLDDDAIASPQWLEKMMVAFETVRPAPASVGGKVAPIWESERPAWLTEDMLTAYAIIDWGNQARFFKPSNPEHHVGCNVAYTREVLQKCGGFNVNLGRKGKNLLSNDENLIKKYIDSHGLGIYYDPEIFVKHLVPKERLTRRFMLRRHLWQGVSDVVLWYEESPSTPGRLWLFMSGLEGLASVGLYLVWFLLGSLLTRPVAVARELSTIETARNYFFFALDRVWSSLGQSRAYFQIGLSRPAKGTAKGVALEQGARASSSPPPKNWNVIRWWSYPYMMLKRTLFGIGGIAVLVIVGLCVAAALVEPLRWYLVGVASGLLILCGGLLAISYARLVLDSLVADQQQSTQATLEELRRLKKEASDSRDALAKMNVGNFRLFQHFNRQLTGEDLKRFAGEWAPKLGLNMDASGLGYMAHRICLAEDACVGRLGGHIETMLLRVLVARAVKETELEVLEIGTLFGIGVAMIHENCRRFFSNVHVTALDPLDGYYSSDQLDINTQMPVTRQIFVHNMQVMNIPKSDYTIIEKLSTEDEAIEQASKRRYNLLIIDGDHSYSGVKHDFYNYRHLVKRGGYIIFDDYGNPNWPGLTDFVDKEVAGLPELELVGTDVRTAVFRVIAPQDFTKRGRKQHK